MDPRSSGGWAVEQLTAFLFGLAHANGPDAVVREAIDRAAESLEAEIAALLLAGSVVASVGFPRGKVPDRELLDIAAARSTLAELPGKGIKKVAILAPAFSADCIETLEEIAITGREQFMHAGGEQYAYIPCLNDTPSGMDMIEHIVRRELQAETIRLQRELDKTIVFVTHDIDEAFLLGDQVVILEKGARIAQIGSPSEIIENPASDFVADFIGVQRGARALRAKHTERGTVLVDGVGRTQGVLVEDTP